MNKQEIIEKIKEMTVETFFSGTLFVKQKEVIKLIEQLDEPQKVKVLQCVAEYIEFKKKNNFHVYGAMRVIEDHYDKRVPEWFYEGNIETFVRAWLYGYEVEEEAKYTVKVKGVCEKHETLNREKYSKNWLFSDREENTLYDTKFTRKELEEAGFGEVFNCPLFEVEEVE